MSLDPWTFVLQLVNFLVLAWLLERLLYRPVLRVVAERQAEVARLAEAQADSEAARAHLAAELEAQSEQARTARDRLLEEARLEAGAERRRATEQAREETRRLLEDARQRIAHEREEALAALRRKSIELGVALARELLGTISPAPVDEAFFAGVCARMEALEAGTRERILGAVEQGEAVRVVTAQPLAQEQREQCSARLTAALGGPVAPQFSTDVALIAGLELYLPGVVVRNCWRDALASAETTLLEQHGGGQAGAAPPR